MNKSLSTLSVIPHIASYVHWGFVIAALRTMNPLTSYNLLFVRSRLPAGQHFPLNPGAHQADTDTLTDCIPIRSYAGRF